MSSTLLLVCGCIMNCPLWPFEKLIKMLWDCIILFLYHTILCIRKQIKKKCQFVFRNRIEKTSAINKQIFFCGKNKKNAHIKHSSSNLHFINLCSFNLVSINLKSRAVLLNCRVMVKVKSSVTLDIPYSQMNLETSARKATTQCSTWKGVKKITWGWWKCWPSRMFSDCSMFYGGNDSFRGQKKTMSIAL